MSENKPLDTKLYRQVVKEAKEKFLVWPSAYASGWVVSTYKKRGGRYTSSSVEEKPLKRWYDENWVNVCSYVQKGILEPCGRKKAQFSNYPYCRPEKRVSPKTPTTLYQLIEKKGQEELSARCKKKKADPSARIK